jgi:hypothetical protein
MREKDSWVIAGKRRDYSHECRSDADWTVGVLARLGGLKTRGSYFRPYSACSLGVNGASLPEPDSSQAMLLRMRHGQFTAADEEGVPIANAIAWIATGADNAGCEE